MLASAFQQVPRAPLVLTLSSAKIAPCAQDLLMPVLACCVSAAAVFVQQLLARAMQQSSVQTRTLQIQWQSWHASGDRLPA